MPHSFQLRPLEFPRVLERIQKAVYAPLADLAVEVFVTAEPVPYARRREGERRSLAVGEAWGKLFDCGWFHFTGVVPASAAGRKTVLLVDFNGEGLVVDGEGNPLQGLTTVHSTFEKDLGAPGKRIVPFRDPAPGGETVDLWVDAGNNDLFGVQQHGGALAEAAIAACLPEMRALAYDFEVLHGLMAVLPETSARARRIGAALYEASLLLRRYTDGEAAAARAVLAPELARRNGDAGLRVAAVGHAHMDLAWLWPVRETIRKGARTFATALHLMDRYPEYVFGASQPQLYQWVKDAYPALYARVKRRIAEGRWEVQGAMWVEPDTNIPGGEALVRQIFYGKQFFRDEFGVEVDSLWLPDVFGYTGALPQLLRKSGIPYFMTQKLSWNLVNKFPHQTFWWEGIDGSRVLAHMLPEETYNSPATPASLHKAEHNYRDSAVSGDCLLLFGIGDGGGGPGEDHLERLRRVADLQGLCPVAQEPTPAFFWRLAAHGDRYATWRGELYLERHQGTLTTQGRSKRANREAELLLREVELAAARACLAGRGYAYPQAALDRLWKEVLLYQFHDILPGSSITRVYDESLARYGAIQGELEALLREADAADVNDTDGGSPALRVANSLSWPRQEWVRAGAAWRRVRVEAMGRATLLEKAPGEAAGEALTAEPRLLENGRLRVEFAADGSLASIRDKEAGREVLAPGGQGNAFHLHDDDGDAWDFPIDFQKIPSARAVLVSSEAAVDGPEAVVRQVYEVGAGSRLEQEIVLVAGSPLLRFRTRVEWRESRRMLRVRFPVAVRAAEALCGIQFGAIARPLDDNTSWSAAVHEIAAHKWIDLSEPGYGVALLNDGKYGHRAKGGVLDLNLLRSPVSPDPAADQGRHEFSYALYPHRDDPHRAEVARRAYEFNVPLRILPCAAGREEVSPAWLRVGAPSVVVEAVKRGKDGAGTVVRLYEGSGARVRCRIDFGFPVGSAALLDLMEDQAEPLACSGNGVEVEFGPFEIHTVRVE